MSKPYLCCSPLRSLRPPLPHPHSPLATTHSPWTLLKTSTSALSPRRRPTSATAILTRLARTNPHPSTASSWVQVLQASFVSSLNSSLSYERSDLYCQRHRRSPLYLVTLIVTRLFFVYLVYSIFLLDVSVYCRIPHNSISLLIIPGDGVYSIPNLLVAFGACPRQSIT
ncbi:hypothetical protein MIND_00904700 [Mycena indigotica]|uniref:Uncharacterized protein n=1 Tax=Mycena indigotica TaxID=2126181 RepID=A0A8H6SDI6_9AGAR|nr:uncharacterized protein MIND_00904700 [Mycena indigotica]KAF7296741.1 hypothetical protein MIND_00904700 [Mycena indigotica]